MRKIFTDLPRPARYGLAVLGGVTLVLLALIAAVKVAERTTDGVLVGTTIEGESVGAMDRNELRRRVIELAEAHAEERVVVRAGDEEISSTREDLGSRLDVTATVEAAWDRGRGDPWSALTDHIAARRGERDEISRIEIHTRRLSAWAHEAARELSTEPRPAGIDFVVRSGPDVGIEVKEGRDGTVVDGDLLGQRLLGELTEPGSVELEVRPEPVSSEIGERDVERGARRARRAVSAPVVLENPTRGDDLELSPEDLAYVLEVDPDEDAPPGERLPVTADGEDLEDRLGNRGIDALEVRPTKASFNVVGDEVRIRGGRAGFKVDLVDAAERIEDLISEPPPRDGRLPGERIEPDFSRQEAQDLGIEEMVSSFQTEFSCCEPRVQNIHLIAEMVDGAIIRPGERFEVNEHVGPRTREKGFAAAPAIVGGEFVDVVGGGVSQFATTFFNAAFFAGIELDDFKPHSYYFDRYPMGHEATISWRSIPLAVVNDSPYGILVRTLYDETSVTVEFWSTEWAEVSHERQGPTNFREGERRDGFDVTIRRAIEYPDGSTEVEEYFHRYQPQD